MTPGNNVIEVVLRLVDEISKPLAGAEAKLAGLKKAALVGGTAAVVAAAAGIGYMVKKLIDAEQNTARLDIAYDNLGKQAGVTRKNLDEYADALLHTTTFSSDVIKQSEALLLTFTKVRGEGFERTLKVAADMATAMGTDLPSAVGRLGRALQQPSTGFELLARSGVRFSLTEQKVIEDMVATGDAAGAQAKLLALLEQRYAGTATAMRNTLGGALEGLKNQLADLVSADRGSFSSTTAAVEKLTAAVGSPEVKTAANTFGTALALLTGKLVDYTAAVINGATATGEFIAKWASGNWRGTGPLDVAFSRRDQLKEELSALNPLVLGYAKRKAALEAELKANEKLIQQLQVENTLSAKYAGNRGAAAAAAATVEGVGDVEERLRKFSELQKDLRTDVQKTADMVKQEMQNIAKLYTLSDAQLAEQGFTRGDLDKAAQALRAKLSDAAAKAGKGASRSFTEALQTDLDRMVWAPRIELTPAEELLRGVVAQTATGMELAKKVALDTWTDFVARLQSLLEMSKITAEQMKEFERRYLDQELQPIVVTVPKILPKTEDFMQPFRERMAENIHDAIAGALEGIGTKSGKDVARDFLNAFRSTIAQAGALIIEKALGLDKLATGGGPLGKIFGALFPRTVGTGSKEAAPGGAAQAPGSAAGGCAAACAEQVVSTVAKTTASGFGDIFKQYASNLWGVVKPLISGAWKAITNIVSKIWDFIKTAIAAIRTIATSASASSGSSGGGLLGMAGSAIASYFGGSAGGGRIPARKPRKVNEEGPEVIVPDVPMRVYNQRQLAFAGATAGGMGGGTFTFAPTYHVKIDAGKNADAKDTAAQFYAVMAKRDAQMEERIFNRLRRNGLGRLSR